MLYPYCVDGTVVMLVRISMLLSENVYLNTTLRVVERGSPMRPLLAATDIGPMGVVDLLLLAGAELNQLKRGGATNMSTPS